MAYFFKLQEKKSLLSFIYDLFDIIHLINLKLKCLIVSFLKFAFGLKLNIFSILGLILSELKHTVKHCASLLLLFTYFPQIFTK